MTTRKTNKPTTKTRVRLPKDERKERLRGAMEALVADYKSDEILGEGGLMQSLTGALIEAALKAEMTEHLGYEKGEKAGWGSGNSRNGTGLKTLKSDRGELPIEVPRDREGSFEPQIVPKYQTRLKGFDEQILALYARGMSVRDIQSQLEELYHTDVSPDLISRVTNEVLAEVKAWQNRLLEPIYPIVYLDALSVKCRDSGIVRNKQVYLALGVNMEGQKEVLGLWIQRTEGAKFWLRILTELKNRGLQDILIACTDGLTGFSEAIEATFPEAVHQTCIVHQLRASTRYVAWKDRRAVLADLKPIYTAASDEAAKEALDTFREKWASKYPLVGDSWESNWEKIVPFLAFPPEIRKVIYTTNAIESINRQLRKVLKTKGHFPNDDAVMKILFLALQNAAKKWTMPIRNWSLALHQFSIHFPGRLAI